MRKLRHLAAGSAAALALLASVNMSAAYAADIPDRSTSERSPTTAVYRPMSEPPGRCEIWEWNTLTLGDDGVYYKCEFVEGGLYWIPQIATP
jgi:hypothetical protein